MTCFLPSGTSNCRNILNWEPRPGIGWAFMRLTRHLVELWCWAYRSAKGKPPFTGAHGVVGGEVDTPRGILRSGAAREASVGCG